MRLSNRIAFVLGVSATVVMVTVGILQLLAPRVVNFASRPDQNVTSAGPPVQRDGTLGRPESLLTPGSDTSGSIDVLLDDTTRPGVETAAAQADSSAAATAVQDPADSAITRPSGAGATSVSSATRTPLSTSNPNPSITTEPASAPSATPVATSESQDTLGDQEPGHTAGVPSQVAEANSGQLDRWAWVGSEPALPLASPSGLTIKISAEHRSPVICH